MCASKSFFFSFTVIGSQHLITPGVNKRLCVKWHEAALKLTHSSSDSPAWYQPFGWWQMALNAGDDYRVTGLQMTILWSQPQSAKRPFWCRLKSRPYTNSVWLCIVSTNPGNWLWGWASSCCRWSWFKRFRSQILVVESKDVDERMLRSKGLNLTRFTAFSWPDRMNSGFDADLKSNPLMTESAEDTMIKWSSYLEKSHDNKSEFETLICMDACMLLACKRERTPSADPTASVSGIRTDQVTE